MSTTSLCVNDYFDAGYFTIPQGIADVESLDFQFQECGCEGICCSTYYFYSAIDQDISYIDCGGNLMEISIKSRTGLFICLSEIVDSGTCLVTQLNECQCCATECYTILATNNSASIINITAIPTTCFGEGTVSILAGGVALICVGEGTLLIYSGGAAENLDMEFVECDCLPL